MHSKCHFINMHREGGRGGGLASYQKRCSLLLAKDKYLRLVSRRGWAGGAWGRANVKNPSDAFVESASLQVFLIQPSAKRLGYIKCSSPTINVRAKHFENTEPVMRTDFFPTPSAFWFSWLMAFNSFRGPNLWQNDAFGRRSKLTTGIKRDFTSPSRLSQPSRIYLVSPFN